NTLNLAGAVPDVQRMQQCLGQACGQRYSFTPLVLTNKDATRKAILEKLKDLKPKPRDVVIVHYSSHGEVDPAGGLFLLTHDSHRKDLKTTAMGGDELRDILGQYPAAVLLILDACHAGNFPVMRPASDPLSRLLADDSCGVAVLCAALASQKAADQPNG